MATARYNAKIDTMVARFLVLASDSDNGEVWTVVCSEPGLQVFKLEGAANCFKVVAELNASPEAVFDVLSDITRRASWDELCEEGHVIEQLSGSTKIQYMKTKAMWPTASRDVVSLGYVGTMPDGRFLNVTASTEHPDYPPNSKAIVRMEAKIAGQIIGPSASGDTNKCSIIQVADGDLKGWIPTNLISYIATQAVPMSFRKLNVMVSKLDPVVESKVLLMSRQPNSYNALSPEKLALTTDSEVKLIDSAVVPSKSEESRVVARPASFFALLTSYLEIASPWLITILFIKVIFGIIRKRRSIANK